MVHHDPATLDNLVEKARQKDESAFRRLMLAFQNLAFAYAFGKLGDYQLAEDAVQEAFITVYYRLGSLRDNQAFPGWLRTVTERHCNRYLRCSAHRARPGILEESLPERQPIEELLERRETAGEVQRAVMALPDEQREVILLFYLEGNTQQQVADFLQIPVATVNNRLHAGRTKLRRSMIKMVGKEINERKLGSKFAEGVGQIVKVRGPFVDVQLEAEELPQILDGLRIAGEGSPLVTVTQDLGQGKYRCMVLSGHGGLSAGIEVLSIDAEGGNQVSESEMASLVSGLETSPGKVIETGIKAIDLFSPVMEGSAIGVFGIQGVGKAVLIGELIRRLAHHPSRLTIVGLMRSNERAMAREMLRDREIVGLFEEAGKIDLVWLLTDLGSNPEYAKNNDVFDTVLYCSPEKAAQAMWPALEPLLLKSKAKVDRDHQAIRDQARALLAETRALMLDPEFLMLLAHGSLRLGGQRHAEFRAQRVAELSPAERLKVERGRKLELFMTQPFIVAEPANQRPGATVPLSETLSVSRDIMSGRYDNIPENAFLFAGGIDEILARAGGQ